MYKPTPGAPLPQKTDGAGRPIDAPPSYEDSLKYPAFASQYLTSASRPQAFATPPASLYAQPSQTQALLAQQQQQQYLAQAQAQAQALQAQQQLAYSQMASRQQPLYYAQQPGQSVYHAMQPQAAQQVFFPGQQVVIPNAFDSGARYSSTAGASIPPPPPGVAPNAAQLAAQSGATVIPGQKKSSFLTGGSGAGTTFW